MHSPRLSRRLRLMLTKDFKDLLRAFHTNAVKYLILGGHAPGVHAEPRTTKGLDLFVRSDAEQTRERT